jgi:hypothetical protein
MWRWEHVWVKQVLELEPENAAGYVMLSKTCMLLLATGISVRMFERQRKERGMKKESSRTWIEVNNELHTFVVDDKTTLRLWKSMQN